jgi:hypothetical protein
MLDGQAGEIVGAIIRRAIEGDPTAQKLCLDRILPARRDRPIAINLPEVSSAKTALDAMAAIVAAMGAGRCTPIEAEDMAKPLGAYLKALEVGELETLLRQLLQKDAG